MLHILVCKALTPWALCQPDIATNPSVLWLALGLRCLVCIGARLVRAREACEVWDRRFRRGCCTFGVSAVKNVVKLGDGIAAFYAYWHAAVRSLA